jgi:hypothetical protein
LHFWIPIIKPDQAAVSNILEWPYFEIHCIFCSADFSAVSAVTSLCAVFFETGSLVGFVVLEFPLDFFQRTRKLAQDPATHTTQQQHLQDFPTLTS